MNRQLILNNNLRVTGTAEIRDVTESTSCTTGALIVAGGVGISRRLNVCGDVKFNSTTASSSTSTGALVVSGGVGFAGNANIGGNTSISGTLGVTGNTTLSANLNVNGNTTLGDNTSDIVYAFGKVGINKASPQRKLHIVGDDGPVASFPTLGPKDAVIIENNGSAHLALVGSTSENCAVKFYKSGSSTADGLLAYDATTDEVHVTFNNIDNCARFLRSTKELKVVGDITAFSSDERLKTNIKPLENALDKVLSLNGFTYNFNELGQSLGFSTETLHVGVSAQQVQAVLPEAVAPAPVNDEYLTVKYEKIVPLLIEAIKELSQKVSDLENKLNK